MLSTQRTAREKKRGNPIYRRTYFKLESELQSPLLIGSGEAEKTDADVLLDAEGKPFLPGTALAGALKHAAQTLFGKARAEALFGKSQNGTEKGRLSSVFVYDAVSKGARVRTRDGVRLDAYKTAVDRGKYEVQILEAGASFALCLELVEREDDAPELQSRAAELQRLLTHLACGEIALGAKSNRGFGKLAARTLWVKAFSLRDAAEREAWLAWDWRGEDAFAAGERIVLQLPGQVQRLTHCLCVPLKVKRTLLIREYAKRFSNPVDYAQLKSGENAVIPGSSWMGAIRARIANIMRQINPALSFAQCQKELGRFFGTWAEEKSENRNASLVQIEESTLDNSRFLKVTRNAIDRFTGGTVAGALYTAEVAVQGDTTLQLCWPSGVTEAEMNVICGLLLWAVKDLQAGLLAVGGETAVGRGIFAGAGEVQLDGRKISEEQETLFLKAAARWCRGI